MHSQAVLSKFAVAYPMESYRVRPRMLSGLLSKVVCQRGGFCRFRCAERRLAALAPHGLQKFRCLGRGHLQAEIWLLVRYPTSRGNMFPERRWNSTLLLQSLRQPAVISGFLGKYQLSSCSLNRLPGGILSDCHFSGTG